MPLIQSRTSGTWFHLIFPGRHRPKLCGFSKTPALYREPPGKPTSFSLPDSEMHFIILPVSAFTLRTRLAASV